MPFQIICKKNKGFWSRFTTYMAAFVLTVVVVAVIFPITKQTFQEPALNGQIAQAEQAAENSAEDV